MAQAMIDRYKLQKSRDVSTQTGNTVDFFINLSKSKHFRLYYNESYKDLVLSFNINNSKSFIVTRQMWKKFREHINQIDSTLLD
jgi:hypothetical protein